MMRWTALYVLACIFGVVGFVSGDEGQSPPEPAVLPKVHILATDPTGLTGSSSAAFTVIRNGQLESDLEVKYTISGSAENGVDFKGPDDKPLSGSVIIPAGYAAADIVIVPLINPLNRGNKTVVLTLVETENYVVGRRNSSVVRLIDDVYNDKPPTVELKVIGGTPNEEGTLVFTLPTTVKLVASAEDADDKVVKVSFYANDHCLGVDYEEPFEFEWQNPRPGTYDLFARAVDQFGKCTLSGAIKIIVNGTPPSVEIVNPSTTSVPAGSDVSIVAKVTVGSCAISKIQFYADNNLLAEFAPKGEDQGPAEYEATWKAVTPGTHKIRVRVIDECGQTANAVFVFKAANHAPVVKITSPLTGQSFKTGTTIRLEAEVSDPDGDAIDHVTFYANGKPIGTISKPESSPVVYEWSNVRPGIYVICASATDAFGARTVSKTVRITVTK